MKWLFIIIGLTFVFIFPDVPGVVQINTVHAAKPMPKNRIKHKFNRAAKPKHTVRGKSKPGKKLRIRNHFNAVAKPRLSNKQSSTGRSSPENIIKGPQFKPPGI